MSAMRHVVGSTTARHIADHHAEVLNFFPAADHPVNGVSVSPVASHMSVPVQHPMLLTVPMNGTAHVMSEIFRPLSVLVFGICFWLRLDGIFGSAVVLVISGSFLDGIPTLVC